MRIRRLVVAVAMSALGLVAVRKLTGRGKDTEDVDVWDAPPPPSADASPVAFAGTATTEPTTTAEQPAASEATATDAPAGTGKIKGNLRSDGEKIYHLPGDAMYERTKAEQEFDTAEEAEAAGFRRVGSPRTQSDDRS